MRCGKDITSTKARNVIKSDQQTRMENTAHFFNNALATSQIAVLPTFANKKNEDKYNSAQWLQNILNHRDGTKWNDQQFITHVRHGRRGDMIDWFNSLKPMKVDIIV